MAGWQSGHAAACKAADAGPIPAPASNFSPGGEIGRRKGLKIPRGKLRAGSSPAPGTSRCSIKGNRTEMTFVITEKCIRCKYTDCVEVCPVDCFYEGPNMLAINPDECIDCGLCEPECPVNAIYAEDDLPENYKVFTELNAELSATWPNITHKKAPPPDADEWKEVEGKLKYLEKE